MNEFDTRWARRSSVFDGQCLGVCERQRAQCSPNSSSSTDQRRRSYIPQVNTTLVPDWPYLNHFLQWNNIFKTWQKTNFNKRRRVRSLSPIPYNTYIWVTSGDRPVPAKVITSTSTPRLYVVQTPNQMNLQRNCRHINLRPRQETNDSGIETSTSP